MLHKILGNSTEGNTINLARKFSIFSPKRLRHRIELPQDRYLNMRKPLNHTACARADLTRSKEHIMEPHLTIKEPSVHSLMDNRSNGRNFKRHNKSMIIKYDFCFTTDCGPSLTRHLTGHVTIIHP